MAVKHALPSTLVADLALLLAAVPATACGVSAPPRYVAAGETWTAGGDTELRIADEQGWRALHVEGPVCAARWVPRDADAARAVTEIHWRYRRQLLALGADLVYLDWRHTVARLLRDGRVRWVQVHTPPGAIDVTVVEGEPRRGAGL